MKMTRQGLSLTFKRRECRFSYLSLLLFVCVLTILLSLGRWQLRRADEKRALIAAQQSAQAGEALTAADLAKLSRFEQVRFAKTTLTGTWDNDHNLLILNKFYKHAAGVEILTPVKVDGLPHWVLVHRGWMPKSDVAHIKPILGQQSFTGIIDIAQNNPFITQRMRRLPEPLRWPLPILSIDFDILSRALGRTLYPFVVRLPDSSDKAYAVAWMPVNMPPEKHLSYAVQWFLLAAALSIVYIAANCRRL